MVNAKKPSTELRPWTPQRPDDPDQLEAEAGEGRPKT